MNPSLRKSRRCSMEYLSSGQFQAKSVLDQDRVSEATRGTGRSCPEMSQQCNLEPLYHVDHRLILPHEVELVVSPPFFPTCILLFADSGRKAPTGRSDVVGVLLSWPCFSCARLSWLQINPPLADLGEFS